MTYPRKTRSEEIIERIRKLIVEQDLLPGSMLPSIEELADEFNVSRTTVREALIYLASMGIVDIRQGVGTLNSSASSSID
ncbi:MAG: FadR family transcriptional regulator, partial [Firmicutes bacterium]|nr:FadR family transcriptional regulator [Bacillota bacterium]